MAKTAGCPVVVGKICWFCCKPAEISKKRRNPLLNTKSLICISEVEYNSNVDVRDQETKGKADSADQFDNAYGGLAILYHLACVTACTQTQTDEEVIAAYKACAATGARDLALPPVGVGVSAMRLLAKSWLHGHRKEQATPSQSDMPTGSQHQGSSQTSDGDSDSDDSRPLCDLAADSFPLGQLVAKRTAFQACAAKPSPTDDDDKDLHEASTRPLASTDMTKVQEVKSGHVVNETRIATAAAQIFASRPGHRWKLKGCVEQLPPVYHDEKRVLSHHLSKTVTEMYDEAQTDILKVKVLQFFEDPDEDLEKLWIDKDIDLRNKVERSAKAYLQRHMQGNKKLLCNLPEDPPCLECLKVEPIQEGDFRAGLQAGVDETVHTASAIAQGTVLGLYRNLTVTKDEEEDIRDNPPAEFLGSKNQWRQKLDAYIADVEQPAKGSKAWRTFNDIFHNVLSDQPLCCLAYMNGNILACINDGVADPMSRRPDTRADRAANTQLVCIAVGRWPFMFVVTTQDIEPGAELFLNYGNSFWAIQKECMKRIREDLEAEEKFERAMASGTLGVDSHGASQLHLTRSGPPVETAMSANQVSPGPLPGESMQHAPTAPSTLLRDAPPAVPSANAAEEDDGQEAAAESQPAPVAAHDLHLHARGADQPGLPDHACQPGPLHKTVKAVAPQASPFEAAAVQKGSATQPSQAQTKQHSHVDGTAPGSKSPAEPLSPGGSGVKRKRNSDTSTLPNTWPQNSCHLCDDIQQALLANPGTVAQQQQSVAAHMAYTDRCSPKTSRLSAVYDDCLEGYGIRRGVYSDASPFLNALSPSESNVFRQKRRKLSVQSSGKSNSSEAQPMDTAPQHIPTTDQVGSRSALVCGAVGSAHQPTTQVLTDAGCHCAEQPGSGEQTPCSPLGRKRKLARLDSNTASSPAAAKQPFVSAKPVLKEGQAAKSDPQQAHDTQPSLPGRALHRDLSGSINSGRTPGHAAVAAPSSGQGKAGGMTAPSPHVAVASAKHGHLSEPPRFNQAAPAIGKSRLAPGSSQQARGDGAKFPAKSGAASGDSGARQHSKGSKSIRTAGTGTTQDTAAAVGSSAPYKKAAAHRLPANIEVKAVPRPSAQDRHCASLNTLRQSKINSEAPGHS